MAKVFIENHICLRYNDRCQAMTWQAVYIFHCIALLVKLVSILMFGQEYAYIFYWIYLVTSQAYLCPFNKVDLRQYMY